MTIEIPRLDDRDFDQLVQEARARVGVHTPEWTNLNESDPGITLVELFAFLTENLLYRSNRIPEANRLKFLSMLGIALQPPSPGVGLVTIDNKSGPLQPFLAVPEGTELRAGQVPFVTANSLAVLPVSAAVYYKQPQQLDAATLAHYQLLYQTFLTTDTETLSFYKPVKLDPPEPGKANPVVDLGDPINGTIDRSLWIALLGQKGAAASDVRRALAGQTLSIGVYPAAQIDGRVLPPMTTATGDIDPGLVVEIAAPDPDPSDPMDVAGRGLGVGPARYSRLPLSYAEPVLEAPGLLQVTLPPYEKLLLWDFEPEEEGTGDFPPRIDDAAVSSRVVSWIRLRYPLPGDSTAAPATDGTTTGAPTSVVAPATTAAAQGSSGCGCGGTISTSGAAIRTYPDTVGSTAKVKTNADLSMAGCQCCDCNDGITTTSTATATATGKITWVGVNATRAVQAVTVRQEALGLAPGTPFHTCTLANGPIITGVLPGAAELTNVLVEVQRIDGSWQPWQQIDDIFAAGREQTVYTLDPATGVITFGDGLTGLRPLRGTSIRASYSYGGGIQGSVPIGGLNKSVVLPSGYPINNPLPTWGAGSGETLAEGEAAISRWLRHRDRLVTSEDFHDLTERTPGVDMGRVEVLPLFNPEQTTGPQQDWPGMVTVMVIPKSDPVHPKAPRPDRLFLEAVCDWLQPRRLVTTELHVRGPVYRTLVVSIGVVPLPGQVPSLVEQAVHDAVEQFLSPLTGGLPQPPQIVGEGWPLGVNVRSQDIEAVATRVPGVRYVDSVLMASVDDNGTVHSPIDTLTLTGLELPEATVYCGPPPAVDPASLIAGNQGIANSIVPVPVVPDTC